ncbi:MAG TPA: intradiol ring-cleavage dioxygenase [Acidimicrobiales bacterium]|nr:intradiol ring-cleavage dioxygenase [Acidimicrobiales bacterium]
MTAAEAVSAETAQLLERSPWCRGWSEQDQGPYHRAGAPVRRGITEDCPGAPLALGIRLSGHDGAAQAALAVEIWHCDALGRYSGFPPSDPTAPRGEYLPGETFLRGRQTTDHAGMVEFLTIYPGWYPGRTVHIHTIVHTEARSLITQLYFPDPVSDEVLAGPPYRDRPGRNTTNDTDTILPSGGTPAVVDIIRVPPGYRAAVCLVLPPPGSGQ